MLTTEKYSLNAITCLIKRLSESSSSKQFRVFSFNFIYFDASGVIVFLFDFILYVPSTIFQLNRDGSSLVKPVLSQDKCVLLKDHNAMTPVRLKPAAPRSWVKHWATALLSGSLWPLLLSTDDLCKHFGPRSGLTKNVRPDLGPKCLTFWWDSKKIWKN